MSGNFTETSQAQSPYEVLWTFHPEETGNPENGVIQGADGAFYGSTWNFEDGDNHMWLFRWEPTGTLAWMTDGKVSWDPDPSPLIETADGYLFFNKRDGHCDGSEGCLVRVRWGSEWTTVHYYVGDPGYPDSGVGHYPFAAIIDGADGAFYGAGTQHGAPPWYDGTVFRLDLSKPRGERATLLHGFPGTYPTPILGRDGVAYQFRTPHRDGIFRELSDGNFYSTYKVIEGSDGALYEMEGGGAFGHGQIVRTTRSGVRQVLHHFDGANGSQSSGPLLEANGYMYGTTMRGGPDDGGVFFRLRVPELSRVDLVQTAVSSPPSSIAPGWSFEVTDTVLNRGSEISATAITRFFLSTDLARDPDDVQLKGGRYVPELATDQSSTETGPVTIPATVAPGTYRLLVCADALNERAEWNEANNCRVADQALTVTRPDLATTAVAALSATANPGGKLGVTDTVQNTGAVGAFATGSRFYLSFDAVKDGNDVLLNGKRSIPVLESGASSLGSSKPTVPSTMGEGTYRVLACADDLKKLNETNETNNCLATSSTVMIGWADIVMTAISTTPGAVLRGQKIRVSDTATNEGTIPSAGFAITYFLSADSVKDGADVLLSGKRSVTNLEPGASSSGSKNVGVPLIVSAGTYFVLACADDLNKVPERTETNNCRASASKVTIQ